jgi:signal transduction histidine kinase
MEQIGADLIVADIMMPRMDGYAFYEAIRARPEWVPIPFIFLTAKAEKEDVLKGKGMGAEDYLTKPFDHQELIVAVRSRLGRAEAIQKVSESKFDELKRQIANVLGHELRTPLTYVRGYTELALEEVPTLSAEGIQEFLEGIKRGADRLNCLVEDLLLLVQLDTGRAADEFHLLVEIHDDVGSILETVLQQYEDQAAARGVLLELNVESELPPVSLCEPYFVDAVGRLVDNGIKFTRDTGKRVTVSARVTDEADREHPADKKRPWVEVAVTDEGVGIAADELPHLFERFRQIDRAKMEQQGVGLGLAIARELINLHSGEITMESTPGEGSTATIRLPVAQEKADEKHPADGV